MSKKIVMIGSSPSTRGGVAAVVKVYMAQGLFSRWPLEYVPTHHDGSKWAKASLAVTSWLAVMARLVTGRIALLHVHMSSGPSFWRKALFILPARLFGVPYVVHLHGGRFIDFYRDQCPNWAKRLVRSVFRNARAVVALSDEWFESLSAMAPGSRIVVVPNPVDIPAWQATLDGHPPSILFLGVLREAKGVLELVNAMPSIRAAVPDAQLVLGGVGDMDAVTSLASQLGVTNAVKLPGWVTNDAKDELIKQAWVFALPSHREALPMSILEAMAAGVPVVASRVGGIPLAVDEGRTGTLIEAQNVPVLSAALIDLLTNHDKRHRYGAAARQRAVDSFSADVMVPKIDALWRQIVPQLEQPAAPALSQTPAR